MLRRRVLDAPSELLDIVALINAGSLENLAIVFEDDTVTILGGDQALLQADTPQEAEAFLLGIYLATFGGERLSKVQEMIVGRKRESEFGQPNPVTIIDVALDNRVLASAKALGVLASAERESLLLWTRISVAGKEMLMCGSEPHDPIPGAPVRDVASLLLVHPPCPYARIPALQMAMRGPAALNKARQRGTSRLRFDASTEVVHISFEHRADWDELKVARERYSDLDDPAAHRMVGSSSRSEASAGGSWNELEAQWSRASEKVRQWLIGSWPELMGHPRYGKWSRGVDEGSDHE